MVEIVLEPNVRRRRGRQPLSGKKKAAALFRVWHGVRELIEQAERLGDQVELVAARNIGLNSWPPLNSTAAPRTSRSSSDSRSAANCLAL